MIPHGPHRWAALSTVVVILVVGWQAHWTGDPAEVQRDRREGYFQVAREVNLRTDGQQVSVLATEIGALGFALDRNVRVLDQVLLVSENPTPGRFPSDRDFVDIHHPEFIAETHPFSADHTGEQLAHQNLRRDPNFELVFEYEGGRTVRYHVASRIESRFGLQVLLQRVD
ncbi:MAG: hypothetical protein JJU11_07005 [Candidatus Sumerlaeia bacterium]|nr:hypothetical protein [Candidatus Sumerlaeia bacterium]